LVRSLPLLLPFLMLRLVRSLPPFLMLRLVRSLPPFLMLRLVRSLRLLLASLRVPLLPGFLAHLPLLVLRLLLAFPGFRPILSLRSPLSLRAVLRGLAGQLPRWSR
jgi:hypothetical protein